MAGGSAAVYETMTALGLINLPDAPAGPPRLAAGSGGGRSALILGAGIGGLTAAYELTRAGYRCEILEAQARAGGRSLTARQGTVITEESPEHGTTHQECQFAPGLYLNMGPGRLPYHHRRVLRYCHDLDVALEVYVMETTANLFQTEQAFGAQAMVNRRIANDTRGYIAELLAKAIQKQALDQELSAEDGARMLDLLRVFGDLDAQDRYQGSTRSGCARPLTVYTACEPTTPLPLEQLLDAEFWRHRFYQPVDFEWQPTLFQPVGGMDKIVEGFLRKVGHLIEYQSVVTSITLLDDGVEVTYQDGLTGDEITKRADFCVSNIPLPVLQKIPANFSEDFRWAVDRGRFAPTCKVGWQANRRFWESDDEIYGGISWIDHLITQMWYPSNDYFTTKGTLTGAYNYDQNAVNLGKMSLAERLRVAREGAIRLHKQFEDPAIVPQQLGLSIAWQNVPFQKVGWADWDGTSADDRKAYARLLAPDRRFHVVGDQVSTLPGWQEGAMMSAEHVVEQIGGLRALTAPEIERAPHTRRLVQGRF
jgi:monoamine oxidase